MSDWVTFDCYGTLADWLGGMRNALDAARRRRGRRAPPARLPRPRGRRRGAGPRARLPRGADRDAPPRRRARGHRAARAGSETALVDHWHELPIFDDVGPALSQLRENGWSLAILSNCDDDLLATTLERMPVAFDLTVTAEQVGSYKPATGHWEAFAQRTEGERGRWVHAAQSWFHDIKTAAELGLPRVWIDRARLGRGRLARYGPADGSP